jgi:hypothetical protein
LQEHAAPHRARLDEGPAGAKLPAPAARNDESPAIAAKTAISGLSEPKMEEPIAIRPSTVICRVFALY